MLEIKDYSREEFAQALGWRDLRTDHMRRYLDKEGYTYTISGRGETYRIHITALPQDPLKYIQEQILGIETRKPQALVHFL